MPTDDRSTNLSLPKPHVDNNMRLEDVPRLRALVDQLDTLLSDRPTAAAVGAAIASAVEDLATEAALTALANATVPTSRQVGTGLGLEGGGTLGTDLSFSLDAAALASLDLADTAVQGTRSVFAGTGLTGGGLLSGNITLSLSAGTITSLSLADSALQAADRPYASDGDAEDGTSLTAVMNADKTRHMLDNRPPGVKTRWISSGTNTTVLATDKGGFIALGGTFAGTVTLPDGLGAGMAVTVYNDKATSVSVAGSGSATLLVAGDGTTGTFTLEAKGLFTAVDTGSGVWIVTGVGLS